MSVRKRFIMMSDYRQTIQYMRPRSSITIVFLVTLVVVSSFSFPTNASPQLKKDSHNTTDILHPIPTLIDPKLKVEVVADNLSVPTGIAFLDTHNILVLKRYRPTSIDPLGGLTTVNLISNGKVKADPVLTVLSGLCDINNPPPGCGKFNERGLLGITTRIIDRNNSTLVGNLDIFIYYTEITITGQILGNRVYKYQWDGHKLINPSLILDLPAKPGPNHNAGKVLIGPDGYLYTIIGDQGKNRGQVQNVKDGPPPNNTSGIFRVDPDNGLPAPDNPFITDVMHNAINGKMRNDETVDDFDKINSTGTLSRYYAYGIRNSFGLAFDPVSGNLWDTENGVFNYDEINLVEPGFNSGWNELMGPIDRLNKTEAVLVKFNGAQYSDPEFSWKNAVGVTALGFFNSSKLGEKYRNNLFVGDYGTGSLYFFKLNKNRDGLEFNKTQPALSDMVADTAEERSELVLGTGFDIITDIQTGPDGYLYIVSYSEYSKDHQSQSRIYRIVPTN